MGFRAASLESDFIGVSRAQRAHLLIATEAGFERSPFFDFKGGFAGV